MIFSGDSELNDNRLILAVNGVTGLTCCHLVIPVDGASSSHKSTDDDGVTLNRMGKHNMMDHIHLQGADPRPPPPPSYGSPSSSTVLLPAHHSSVTAGWGFVSCPCPTHCQPSPSPSPEGRDGACGRLFLPPEPEQELTKHFL